MQVTPSHELEHGSVELTQLERESLEPVTEALKDSKVLVSEYGKFDKQRENKQKKKKRKIRLANIFVLENFSHDTSHEKQASEGDKGGGGLPAKQPLCLCN